MLISSPVRHKLQPISHLRVWHVLHLQQQLPVNTQRSHVCAAFQSSHHLNKLPGKLCDGNLTRGPHVVYFSHVSLFQEQEEGFDGVVDKQEVTGYGECSLDGAVEKPKNFFMSTPKK